MKQNLIATTFVILAGAASAETAKAVFLDAEGNQSGTAALSDTKAGVLVEIDVSGLPGSQWVAFHMHQTGTCDHVTHYDSAGGHFNSGEVPHGYLADGGPHAGDMPNQWVGADGSLRAQVLNPAVTLADGETGIRGRALMIHAGPDDYSTQPTGGAGARLACAVIK
ncbi:MAG: superoxide dismutase [Cereibacter sphaeroides]|uniref:Superoxide dismutase [Cu-Zn] n=1 Tax=Cereibacter sphaeroides TaxID=1063 RepID=A0A2W5SHW0_CERSP|nr:MAG: superoxide dismutase [Cereibacter sphaeroides]